MDTQKLKNILDTIALHRAAGNRCRHREVKSRLFWHFYSTSDNSVKDNEIANHFASDVRKFDNDNICGLFVFRRNNVVMVKFNYYPLNIA